MTKQIPLSKQKRRNSRNAGLVALVDDEDYEWLSQWNWTAVSTHRKNGGYAVCVENGRMILMHRLILDAQTAQKLITSMGEGWTIGAAIFDLLRASKAWQIEQ